MSKPSHTPGPWAQSHREQPNGDYITQVYCENGVTIASLAWYPVELGDGITGTSREANARLIASAPDLLSALELAAEKAALNCTDAEWQQIVSVLRKARGEQG